MRRSDEARGSRNLRTYRAIYITLSSDNVLWSLIVPRPKNRDCRLSRSLLHVVHEVRAEVGGYEVGMGEDELMQRN